MVGRKPWNQPVHTVGSIKRNNKINPQTEVTVLLNIIDLAVSHLESSYVKNNKSRLGVLGSSEIDIAISLLKSGD